MRVGLKGLNSNKCLKKLLKMAVKACDTTK